MHKYLCPLDIYTISIPSTLRYLRKRNRKKQSENCAWSILYKMYPISSPTIVPCHTPQNLVEVALAAEILALLALHLEELVQEIPGFVAALQTLLAMEVAALRSRDASAARTPQAAGVFHTDVDVAEIPRGAEALRGALAEGVRVAAGVVAAVVEDHLPHDRSFGAVEAHVGNSLPGLDREALPSPFG
jgi:hypothetical protein